MDDNSIKKLVEKYGTPAYIFDGEAIVDRYNYMRDNLPKQFNVFYSVKANSALGICQILQKSGSGIEVASAGELSIALKAGFNPSDILFSGPGKEVEEIQYAIDSDIAAIITESIQELEIINELGEKSGKVISVGIRINPHYESVKNNPVISMMGAGTQFGIDRNDLVDAISYIKRTNYLNLICFHIYAGSQIFDHNVASAYFNEATMLLSEVIREHSLNITILDFGGGFGVSYDGKKGEFDFKAFSLEVGKIYEKNLNLFKNKRLIFESGRYLVANSGYYVTEIQYRKQINGTTFLITNGGMNQNALSTYREKKIRGNFKMYILDCDQAEELVSVAGPLCTPDDVLGRNVTLKRADRGNFLCIPNAGAYGCAFSPLEFLGHPQPIEILIYDKQEHIIRKRGNYADAVKNQTLIPMKKPITV